MNNQVDQPLKDKVYVLTRHESRNEDVDDEDFRVLGIYNSKTFACEQMLLDFVSVKEEEAEMNELTPEDFWNDAYITANTGCLEQDFFPVHFYWDITEMEIK